MKKQITALLCSAIVCGTACAALPRANATEVECANKISIAAYEPVGDLDIFSVTEVSSTEEWIFNMVYDRLLEVDDEGQLQPSLIESWEFVGYDSYSMSMSKLKSLPPAGDWNSSWEYHSLLPDLPENPSEPFEWQGYKSPVPTRGWDDYLDGDGLLIIQLNLRDDLNFNDGCPIITETVKEMIFNAKGSNSDTLIYRQWQPVYKVECIDDFTMQLYLSFSGLNYGFMDFMYGLASPYGSIVHKEGDEIIGSGAYNVVDNNNYIINLARNDNWWGGSVPTPNITFVISEDNDIRYSMLHSGEADISILDGEESVYQYYEETFDYAYVETNPIVAFYNPNSEYLYDVRMRRACDYGIYNSPIGTMVNLSDRSNDFWTIIDSYDDYFAKVLMAEAGYPDGVRLNMLAADDQVNKTIAEIAQRYLAEIGIDLLIDLVPSDLFENDATSGNYDIILAEIDLHNINSIYNAFKNRDEDELSQYISLARSAAAEGSCFRSYYDVQKYCYNEAAYMTYFGWRNKVVASNFDVKGFELPQGLYPLGDMSRLDFRWVYKTV